MNKSYIKWVVVGAIALLIAAIVLFITQCSHKSDGGSGSVTTGQSEATAKPTPITVKADDDNAFPEEAMNTPVPSVYNNNKVLTAKDANGGELSIGCELNESISGLVLNPKYSSKKLRGRAGYYIENSYKAHLDTSQADYIDIYDENAANMQNLYINWTKDRTKNAEYVNPDEYGIKWALSTEGPKDFRDSIVISVIDVQSYNMLAEYTISIEKKDSKYEIVELYCNDISVIPEEKYLKVFLKNDMTAIRQELIDKAIGDANDYDYTGSGEVFTSLDVVCSILDKPKFMYYIDDNNAVNYSAKLTGPIVSVTLQCGTPSIGHITQYYYLNGTRVGTEIFRRENVDSLKEFLKPHIDNIII